MDERRSACLMARAGASRLMLLVLTILVACSDAFGLNGERLVRFEDRSYTFSLWFKTDLPKDTLINILYALPHVSKYSGDEGSATLIAEHGDSYEVELEFSKLFYESKSVVRRTRDLGRGAVSVDVIEFWHNRSLLPGVVRSHAEYRLLSLDGGYEVEYLQITELDEPLNWAFEREIRTRLDSFADSLLRYVEKVSGDCKAATDHSRQSTPAHGNDYREAESEL